MALAGYPVVTAERLQPLAAAFAAVALVLLVPGLAGGWHGFVNVALVALGGEYAVRFATEDRGLDAWTPLYAGGFVLLAELAHWSLERRVAAWAVPALLPRRLAVLAATVAGSTALAALVLVAAGAPAPGGVGLEAVGVAAAVLALGVVALLARSRPST